MSGVSLQKGQNISLEKDNESLSELYVGLGWDIKKGDGEDYDLDVLAFICDENEQVLDQTSFIFYNNKESTCKSVKISEDNRTGEGDGDDEYLNIDLKLLPEKAVKVIIAVSIHDSESRKQNFGQVQNSYVRILDKKSNEEIIKYEMDEDYSMETLIIFGELYKRNNIWKFRARGEGYRNGLGGLATDMGIILK